MFVAAQLHSVWTNSSSLSKAERQTLKQLSPAAIASKFAHPVRFNKAGFRGEIGLGATEFNRHTTKQILAALIELLKQTWSSLNDKKALIFCDTRFQSAEAAQQAANIFSSFGLAVLRAPTGQVHPSPFLNYLLKKQVADIGIMITSSHQRPNTNGIKIFFPDQGMASNEFVSQLNHLIQTKHLHYLEQTITPNQKIITEQTYDNAKENYFSAILQCFPPLRQAKPLKIVYSSLHGTGWGWTDEVLRRAGHSVTNVPEQCTIDPHFSHALDPNPENPQTFQLAIALAQKITADLIIINDPDADRVRAAIRTGDQYRILDGNNLGTIFTYFLLNNLKRKGTVYTTTVSTNLTHKIAQSFACPVVETITGFANLSSAFTRSSNPFLLAFEESLGFLVDSRINSDKDGVFSGFFLAYIASWLAQKNQTLSDFYNEIGQKYGFFSSASFRPHLTNQQQVEEMTRLIKKLTQFGPYPVRENDNYADRGDRHLFKMHFAENFWFACRPSVTEPIYKFYFVCWAATEAESVKLLTALKAIWKKEFAQFFPAKS